MFVKFASIELPNSISEEEARWLVAELLRPPSEEESLGLVTPITADAAQAALKIERGWAEGHEVKLSDEEKRAALNVLDKAAQPGGTITDRLRWLQVNLKRSLGIDAH